MTLSYANYKIGQLWGSFMPDRKYINNTLSNELIALTLYTADHFTNFKLTNEFEKWACTEVADFEKIPTGMEDFVLSGGLYAIFHYRGSSAEIAAFYRSIFEEWLPNSNYTLDQRPHVEVMGEKYKNNEPDSEEEIWIPIKPRA
jgi:AraC family transcriptional regulator